MYQLFLCGRDKQEHLLTARSQDSRNVIWLFTVVGGFIRRQLLFLLSRVRVKRRCRLPLLVKLTENEFKGNARFTVYVKIVYFYLRTD